ncbi:MAG: hypothetical protein NTW21_07140 [Verrucomicrobia bacterium]|nr:hypothetical protein [Verrucomicrobiota bacterium]
MIRISLEAFQGRWANLHPLVRFLILLAAATAISFVAVSGPYQRFKVWRLERNLVAARNAVEDLSMHEARDLSLTVLRADESCVEAFRILEKATASLRDPWHGEIARALLSHPGASDADRLTAFRGIAPEVPLGLLKQAWTMLPDRCHQDLRFVTVFADRLITERRFKEATLVLLAVPAAARTPAVDQRLIRILIGSGMPEGFDEAQHMLAGMFPPGGQEISEWLDLLGEIPLDRIQPKTLVPVRMVLEDPASGAVARTALMRARLDYATDISRRTAILDVAISTWKEHEPQALADFLSHLGLYQLLLETLPTHRLNEHPELFPRLLEASQRSGAWTQAIDLLDSHGDLIPKFEEQAHRAVAAAKTGDSPAYVLAWTNARGEAKISPQPGAFLTLQRIAREAALDKEAEQAMVEAIRCGRGPLPLYADLKPLLTSLAQQGQDKTLLEICAIYLPFESTNPVLITQLAYLASLNQLIEPKTVLAAMEHLATGFPKEVPIQCVLATAYLCAGQPAQAAATLDRLELDPAKLSPGYRAAYLTTQALTHRIARDDPRITALPWKSLLPSERKKFNDLLRAEENAETLKN